jgi:hypothetical protein
MICIVLRMAKVFIGVGGVGLTTHPHPPPFFPLNHPVTSHNHHVTTKQTVDINQTDTPINQQLSMKKVWTFHRPTLTTHTHQHAAKGAADFSATPNKKVPDIRQGPHHQPCADYWQC